ncbi:hypothetical protein Tco_1503589 [Tanacetum coccineum]
MTEIQATLVTITDPSPTVLLRFSELERKVEALSKYDHYKVIEESVQANVHNEFRYQISKFLPKAVFDFFNLRIKSIICKVLQKTPSFLAQSSSTHGQSSSRSSESLFEYGLKKINLTEMDRSRSSHNDMKSIKRSSVELEYHLEQRYLAFSDKLDGANPEGDRCPFDLSKPLPSQGHPGHLTILIDFFFNNDLEYLKTGNMERKCTASITKTKAARYDLEFIEDMIPRLWIPVKVAYDKDVVLGISH